MSGITLDREQYLELEKLGIGAFAPLTGFMTVDEFQSVVKTMRLPDGAVFPIPIILDIDVESAAAFRGAARVPLIFEDTQVGEIAPDSFFECDRESAARALYGTDDRNHPGVANFLAKKQIFVGGPTLFQRRVEQDNSQHELTPAETKVEFASRGWERIVGFQTRNVPHRAHEYLQRVALEVCDGLFIQPLVGKRKIGDYTPDAILTGYRKLIADFYRSERVLLGVLSTAMRYAGPREAVFHAIVRRNYGCTDFIVGRDHAGVGDYYDKYAAHELTRRFNGELGIRVLRLHGPYYCSRCDGIASEHVCPHWETAPDAITEISGTMIRAMLTSGSQPAPHLMRPEIIKSLSGVKLFIEEDEE